MFEFKLVDARFYSSVTSASDIVGIRLQHGRFTYLLDTQTGTIWNKIRFKDLEGEPEVWTQEVFYGGIIGDSGYDISSVLNPISYEK